MKTQKNIKMIGAAVVFAMSLSCVVTARAAGDYKIALPRKARKITEVTTERPAAENAGSFKWRLPKHSTAVFLMECQ